MGYLVLVIGLVQAAIGVSLLVSWAKHAHGRDVGLIVTHAVAMLGFFVPWSLFVATGAWWWAWAGFIVLIVFIGFGDAAVTRRTSRARGVTRPGLRDYWQSMVAVGAGRFGHRLQIHTFLSAFVFFPALAVAIVATAAAG